MMSASQEIIIRKEGCVGRITLNRPDALNALNHDMVLQMLGALKSWLYDNEVTLVLVDAVGERAFCAGGDILSLYNSGKSRDFDTGRNFWRDEYKLNALIAHYPKHYVAIMDGIVMGGGVGISVYGSHRVVTERTMLAMPECSIGLVPDVGGSSVMAMAPGYCGEYIGLTGAKLSAVDSIYTGFADVIVPSSALQELKLRLVETGDVDVLSSFSHSLLPGSIELQQLQIDQVFRKDNLTEIFSELENNNDQWSKKTLEQLKRCSPSSLLATFAAIKKSRLSPGIIEALKTDFRFVSQCMEYGDFLEGIRAAIVDKDRKPVWRYKNVESLPDDILDFMKIEPEGGDFDFHFDILKGD